MLTAESHVVTLYIKFSVVFSACHPTFNKGCKDESLFQAIFKSSYQGNLIFVNYYRLAVKIRK